MISWRLYLVLGALAVAMLVLACGSSATPPINTAAPTPADASGQAAFSPVTLESCSATTGSDAAVEVGKISFTYTEPPSRAIALNQHVTEIMLALGLQDRMVGTAYIDDQIPPEYRDAYDSIPVLAEEYPSKEVILAQEPDFVYGGFSSSFRDEVAGTQADLKGLGIGSYLTVAICEEETSDTLEDVYTDIRNVGKIFGVSDRAEALVASLKQDVGDIESKLDAPGTPLRVFMYDSGDDAPFAATCCSMFSNLIATVGGENIFGDVNGRWGTVSWEEVIQRDPEVIVLTEAVWSTSQEKIALLLSNPAYADITAVKNRRFVVLQFSSLVPGIRNATAIRELAEGIYPDRFP
jgi:iron complex transport system substrate-binding protein